MQTLLEWIVSNALTASVLAAIALWVGYRFPRRPALVHACWLLVLIKLVTPPIFQFSVRHVMVRENDSLGLAGSPVLVAPDPVPAREKAKPLVAARGVVDESLPIEEWEIQELIEWYESTWGIESIVPPGETIAGKPKETEPACSSLKLPPPATEPPVDAAEPATPAWVAGAMLWLRDQWPGCLLGVSLGGTTVILLVTLFRLFRFRKLLRDAEPASENLVLDVHRLGQQLGLAQLPGVYVVPVRVGPLLGHLGGRTVMVLPAGLIEDITSDELRTVLAHELTHYRRGDHLWRYLELLAVAFYWWLPSAWLASRRLRQAEEECCDAGVIASLPELAGSYATALVRSLTYVTGSGSPCPALTSGLGPVTLLKRRLAMMRQHVERRLGLRGWLMLMAVAGVALPVGFTLAQEPPQPPDPPAKRRAERAEQERRAEREEAQRRSEAARAERRRAVEDDEDEDTRPGRSLPGRPVAPPPPVTPPGGVGGGFVPGTPGLPPTPPMGGMVVTGQSEDMRGGVEMAVKQAELDLKARRLKVRAAESAAKLARAEVERSAQLSRAGGISSTEVAVARARLENAEIEVEMAMIDVERAELALEQAKRRMSTLGRLGSGGPGPRAFSGQGFGAGGFGGTSQGIPSRPGAAAGQGGGGRAGFGARVRSESKDDAEATPPAAPKAPTPPAARAGGGMGPASAAPPAKPGTPPPVTAPRERDRRDGATDSRDERIKQLERELREMRRALEEMRRRGRGSDGEQVK